MKTEDEAYDGILLKRGDEGYRYYSLSNSSTSSASSTSSGGSNGSSSGSGSGSASGSHNCSYCLGTGWFNSSTNCSHCDAWRTNLAPISYTYSYEASADEGMSVCISGVCGNAQNMYIYDYTSLNSSFVQSEHASANRIKRTMTFTPGTHYVKIKATSTACGSAEQQFTLKITGKSYDCTYCKDTGKINTGVCTHCDACPESLLKVTWNEEEIKPINGTDKAYVPITAEANTNYEPIWIRIVVEDAETNEEIWQSSDFSTQSFTASSCNLQNGTYNVYAVMTVLSNGCQKTGAKKHLNVTQAAFFKCWNCYDTGLIAEKIVCDECEKGDEYISDITLVCNGSTDSSGWYALDIMASCEDSWNIVVSVYDDLTNEQKYSKGASNTCVTGRAVQLSEGRYRVVAKVITSDGYTRTHSQKVSFPDGYFNAAIAPNDFEYGCPLFDYWATPYLYWMPSIILILSGLNKSGILTEDDGFPETFPETFPNSNSFETNPNEWEVFRKIFIAGFDAFRKKMNIKAINPNYCYLIYPIEWSLLNEVSNQGECIKRFYDAMHIDISGVQQIGNGSSVTFDAKDKKHIKKIVEELMPYEGSAVKNIKLMLDSVKSIFSTTVSTPHAVSTLTPFHQMEVWVDAEFSNVTQFNNKVPGKIVINFEDGGVTTLTNTYAGWKMTSSVTSVSNGCNITLSDKNEVEIAGDISAEIGNSTLTVTIASGLRPEFIFSTKLHTACWDLVVSLHMRVNYVPKKQLSVPEYEYIREPQIVPYVYPELPVSAEDIVAVVGCIAVLYVAVKVAPSALPIVVEEAKYILTTSGTPISAYSG